MFVQRERVATRTTRPRVDDNSFDSSQCRGSQPSSSTSRSRLAHASTSRTPEFPNDEVARCLRLFIVTNIFIIIVTLVINIISKSF